jgi:hypothetical protein
MKDGLTKFELQLKKPRTKWSKADWRNVAHKLAGIKHTQSAGRKPKTPEQIYESEQALLAAEFWRDQAIEMFSVADGDRDKLAEYWNTPLDDGVVGIAINRKTTLNKEDATKKVLDEMLARLDEMPDLTENDKKQVKKIGGNKANAAAALVRKIQGIRKNRREK